MAVALGSGMLFAALLAPGARANLISVDNLGDNLGTGCQLREAITAANGDAPSGGCPAGGGARDTINITVPGEINLDVNGSPGLGELVVSSPIDIAGLGSEATTITQDSAGRILHVSAAGDLGLSGATVTGGALAGPGVGIFNEGVLTLNDVKVTNNLAGDDGAGIHGAKNSSTTIINSQIGPGNKPSLSDAGNGGGIAVVGGELDIQSSLVYDNDAFDDGALGPEGYGGGIYATRATVPIVEPSVTISNSQIGALGLGNRAELSGGGIWIENGDLEVNNTLIYDNAALGSGSEGYGGGVRAIDDGMDARTYSIKDSILLKNAGGGAGGGIFTNVLAPNLMEVEGSTLVDNAAQAGGAINAYGRTLVLNSTLSDNTANNNGGAMVVNGSGGLGDTDATVTHTTIAANQSGNTSGVLYGGGVGDTFTLTSSALQNPEGDDRDCNPGMPIVSGGNNVVSDNTCALGGANDAEGVSPLLAALADNGGQVAGIPPGQRVRTHALPPGSPAVNRAPCMGLTADQRDFARPFPVGGLCDSGAFEYRDSDGDGIEDGVDPTPFGDPPPPVVFSTPPSNAFAFGKLKRNKKKGIAFLFVKVPGPGQLGLAGPGLRPLGLGGAAKALAVAGGTVKLRIAPHKKGRKARKLRKRLKKRGKSRVKARVTYVPSGGAANTKVRKLKLIRKR